MAIRCKGICTHKGGVSHGYGISYDTHYYCSTCELMFKQEVGYRCPCCHMPLRLGKKRKN